MGECEIGWKGMEALGEILVLLKMRAMMLWNSLLGFRKHSKLKICVVAFLASSFWVGMLCFFYRGFAFIRKYLEGLEGLGEALIALFFFSLALMLVLSNVQISFSCFYRSSETEFLMTCPLRGEVIFLYKLIESVVFSSWAFGFLGLPVMLGHGFANGANPVYYLWIPLFFGAFVVLPAGVGGAVALCIQRFVPVRARRGFLLGLVCLGVMGLWVGLRLLSGLGQISFLSYYWMRRILRSLEFCQNPLFPSQWVVEGLTLASKGRSGEALFYLGVLLSNGLFFGMLAVLTAERYFTESWSQTGRGSKIMRGWRFITGRFFGLRGGIWTVMRKDILAFVRDPAQWSQCAIFFGLLALYILNLRSIRGTISQPVWLNLTSFLNLLACLLVLSTLTTRFIFPSMSLEGRRFWVLGLSPLSKKQILWGKFLFSFTGSALVTIGVVLLSDSMLGLDGSMMAFHIGCVVLGSAGLSGIAVGLGTVYRDPQAEDPARVVAGFGGTLTLILSLGYVVFLVMAIGVPSHLGNIGMLGGWAYRVWYAVGGSAVLLVSAVGTVVPMVAGRKALETAEF